MREKCVCACVRGGGGGGDGIFDISFQMSYFGVAETQFCRKNKGCFGIITLLMHLECRTWF